MDDHKTSVDKPLMEASINEVEAKVTNLIIFLKARDIDKIKPAIARMKRVLTIVYNIQVDALDTRNVRDM